MVMGPPQGIRHGKAKHRFEIVEWIRDLKEVEGLSEGKIFKLLSCIPRETLND